MSVFELSCALVRAMILHISAPAGRPNAAQNETAKQLSRARKVWLLGQKMQPNLAP